MSNCGCGCNRPENTQETPDKCSPEQIEECHGDKADHCCEDDR
jgi:hypothetical protein